LKLTSGANILASTITPFVTGAVAAGINQNIQQSLSSAGPFGAALSTLGTGLVNQAFNSIGNSIFSGASSGATGSNYKSFPGAGDEPPADYGGSSYTLGPTGGDVVFSIQPANQGPQAFGINEAVNAPKSATTLPLSQFSSVPLTAGSPEINTAKLVSMGTTGDSNLSIVGTANTNFSSLRFR
jgi:hypothetical protein